jgi:thioredoxin 1
MSDLIAHLSDSNFHHAVLDSDRPLVVGFHADWCASCRAVAPVLEELAREREDLSVAKLDIDSNPRTAVLHGVRSLPTMLLFRDGRLVGSVVGAQPKFAIEAAFDRVLSAANEETS